MPTCLPRGMVLLPLFRTDEKSYPVRDMPHREFVDADGHRWWVWEVHPTPAADGRLPVRADHAGGWLAFECDMQRRRLIPVPSGWAEADEPELRRLCRRAEPFSRPNRLVD